MIPTYASFRQQPPGSGFSVSAIAGNADLLERNFYIQFQNRAGRSLLSVRKTVTSTGVKVTLNKGLILDTEEVFWVVIAGETTGVLTDAGIIGRWQAREPNQLTRRGLPVEFDFIDNEHFVTNRSLPNSELLDTSGEINGVEMMPGAIAYVVENNRYYIYDPEGYVDSEGRIRSYNTYALGLNANWIEWGGTGNAYLAETTNNGGADKSLNVATGLPIPPKVTDRDSTALRYWLNNGISDDAGSPIISARYTLDIRVDGIDGYEGAFANKFQYYLVGYVDRATLNLNTDIETVGQQQTWNPNSGLIELTQELPRNHAAVYDLVLSFNNEDLLGVLPSQESKLQVSFIEVTSTQGKLSQTANLIGNLVFSDRQKLLIVPGLLRLPGLASIRIDNASMGYLIDASQQQPIENLQPDTPNQRIVIAGSLNGMAIVRQQDEQLLFAEQIRAVVSTEPGVGALRASGEIEADNNSLTITVSHPVTDDGRGIIRNDYPDIYLAGSSHGSHGEFTPVNGYVFLDINGDYYQSAAVDVSAIATQTFQYDSTDDFTSISQLPEQSQEDFSLFQSSAIAITKNGSGSFTGNIKAYFAYSYESPNLIATSIRHDAEAVIPTAILTLAQIISQLSELVAHVGDRSNPHEVTTEQIGAARQEDLEATDRNVSDNTATIETNVGAIADNTAAIKANSTAISSLPKVKVYFVNTIAERDALTNVAEGSVAKVADDGAGNAIDYIYDSDSELWSELYTVATTGSSNNVYEVATITERDALTDLVEGDLAFVRDSGNGKPRDYAWDGTTWLAFVGTVSGVENNVYEVTTLIERDALTGLVEGDLAFVDTDREPQQQFVYNGNTWVEFETAVQTPLEIQRALVSLSGTNKLPGSAIANFFDLPATPIDGHALVYNSNSDSITWQLVDRGIGAGTILLPSSQSLFVESDGTSLTAYSPEIGSQTWNDIKVVSQALEPNNTIVDERLVINTINTGAVIDLGATDTVLELAWTVETSGDLGAIARYSSDGNMLLIEFSREEISLLSIQNDVRTVLATSSYSFSVEQTYSLQIRIVGVQYEILVSDSSPPKLWTTELIGYSNLFLDQTFFGVGKV